jgi:hypothetical protein
MLTVHGIECAFSLPLNQFHVPITLQVLEVESVTSDSSLSPNRVEVTLSDGVYRSPMILAKWLHHLGSELHQGDIVTMTNYISERVDDNKVVVICLDVAVVTASEDIIGFPSDFSWSLQLLINRSISLVLLLMDCAMTAIRVHAIGHCLVLALWTAFDPQ